MKELFQIGDVIKLRTTVSWWLLVVVSLRRENGLNSCLVLDSGEKRESPGSIWDFGLNPNSSHIKSIEKLS